MKAVVTSVFRLSAAALPCAAAFSASVWRYCCMAVLSPYVMMLSLYAFSAFLARLASRASLVRKSNGILYDWSRNMVFFFMLVPASESLTAISLASTVVSLIQKLSTIPPFSLFCMRLYM